MGVWTGITRLTSKFSKICDTEFISKLFNKLPKLQRKCVILTDEVYVKAVLRFHGGSAFGKAVNDRQNSPKLFFVLW